MPGTELDLRIQYRADVFDEAAIAALADQFQRVVVAMITDPGQPVLATELRNGAESSAQTTEYRAMRDDVDSDHRAPATRVEQILAEIYGQVLAVDRVGVDQS
ncbi:hypothetical protein C6A85_70820, partial [Mycobacterium sp. ITM-2017-0098]